MACPRRRRYPAVLAEFSVVQAEFPDTGSLPGDIRQPLRALTQWLSHPRFSRILPDLVAEMARNPELSGLVEGMIGQARRDRGRVVLERALLGNRFRASPPG